MSGGADVSMFESGWFGQGPAFWRWVVTPEAKPYVEAFMETHRRPDFGTPFDLLGGDDVPGLLDPDHLEGLVRDIEAQFAMEEPSSRTRTR